MSPDAGSSEPITSGWLLYGVALTGIFVFLSALSHRFVFGSDMAQRPIITLVFLLMVAGAIYLRLSHKLVRQKPVAITGDLLVWIVVVGLGMRLLMFPSLPMLEDDYHRYLWDGAVTAEGINPYTVVPAEAQAGAGTLPDSLAGLKVAAGQILERVNHPSLRTVYPPVAAAVFVLAHEIMPFSLGALRGVYLLFDLVALFLLWRLLARLGAPQAWIMIYWWNPLLVKEIYNSGHMDILLVPFALAALYFAGTGKNARGAVALSLAVAAKLWPVLLAPVLFARLLKQPLKLGALAVGFVLLCLLLLSPMAPALSNTGDSGLVAYGDRWEMNDALFMVFPWAIQQATSLVGMAPSTDTLYRGGRIIAAGILLLVIAWVTLRRPRDIESMAGSALAVVATLFLLSPTQFPWYFTWVLPFLALRPRFSLLLLTVMLPLYYLKFHYDARGNVDFFHYRVVWLEYAPVWIALVVEGVGAYRRSDWGQSPGITNVSVGNTGGDNTR